MVNVWSKMGDPPMFISGLFSQGLGMLFSVTVLIRSEVREERAAEAAELV
jgi:hypothetical protein